MELRHKSRRPARILDEGIERNKAYESIVTLGMRGDGDMPCTANSANIDAARKDRGRPARHHRRAHQSRSHAVPQVWALYKEVQEYYEKGMRVPDDVTLLWCDDNWGNIRRLPTAEERKRARRRGHLLPLRLRRRSAQLQMDEHQSHPQSLGADESGAISTVPTASGSSTWATSSPWNFPSSIFSALAWNPEQLAKEKIDELPAVGGAGIRRRTTPHEIAAIVSPNTQIQWPPQARTARARHLQPRRISMKPIPFGRLEGADARRPRDCTRNLPAAAQDAFFELVLHPVKACAHRE